MKTSDFYYDLPQEQIAQTPIEPRDHSRLMVLHRDSDKIDHKHFYDIIDYLNEGDCLIVNDSRVSVVKAAQRKPLGNAGKARQKSEDRHKVYLR